MGLSDKCYSLGRSVEVVELSGSLAEEMSLRHQSSGCSMGDFTKERYIYLRETIESMSPAIEANV